MKEGTRIGTAVVLLVGVQADSPTRGVRRERRGPAQQVRNASRGLSRVVVGPVVLAAHASSGEPRLHTD